MVKNLAQYGDPRLPKRLDATRLAKLITERVMPVSATIVRRELSHLPRVFVGRSALYDTAPALQHFEDRVARAPTVAGNVPPPRQPRGTASAGGLLSASIGADGRR